MLFYLFCRFFPAESFNVLRQKIPYNITFHILRLLFFNLFSQPLEELLRSPAALTLQESVGTLSGDVWTRQGADFGKFLALRSLLAIRSEWNLMEPHAMTRIAEDAADSLLAMALEDSPLVLLLRTAAMEETWGRRGCVRSRVSVELPTTCGEETEWSLAFDSDARGLLDGTQEVMEPIPVYNCSATNKEWGKAGRVRSRERWCVNVFLGSFAVKILRREKC